MKNLVCTTLLLLLPTSAFASNQLQAKSFQEQFAEFEQAISEAGTIGCDLQHDHGLDDASPEGFERVLPRFILCAANQPISPAVAKTYCITDDNSEAPAGFNIRSQEKHPLFPEGNPTGDKPERQIDIRSADQALNETFLYLGDYSGGPDSHDVKSVMYLLPRRSPPKAKVVGKEVRLTLATGELVVFDAATGAVRSGALKEGPPDFNSNRHLRKPPNVHYQGSGISVRLDHRFNNPTHPDGDPTAEVKQGSKSCQVPREKLFSADGKLKTKSDADMLKVINHICPGKGFSI